MSGESSTISDYAKTANRLQSELQNENKKLLKQESVPYTRYGPIFKCILPFFETYERAFFATSYTISLLALFSQAFATLLHLQTENSILFQNINESDRWGYIVGLIATFAAGANVLLPFSKSAGECREVSALIARHLVSKEDVPITTIYRIYSQNTLCFKHPTIQKGCTIEELCNSNETKRKSSQPAKYQLNMDSWQSTPQSANTALQTTIEFTTYSEMLLCASRGFNKHAERFFLTFYILALIQLLFTAATALFHGNNLFLTSTDTSNLFGLLSGFIGTISGGILAVIPIETSAYRCRNAYCICNEYLLSETDMPSLAIQSLYETPCLCFTNPLLEEECRSMLNVV